MRMLVPHLSIRREIDQNLVAFFRRHNQKYFNRAISQLCKFYRVKRPKIEWYAYIDWGKTAGKTYENGEIHLVHPLYWKRGRIYNRERMWVQTVYHELGHYLLWSDPEKKAEAFCRRMVYGLRQSARRKASTASRASSGQRRRAEKSSSRRMRNRSRRVKRAAA